MVQESAGAGDESGLGLPVLVERLLEGRLRLGNALGRGPHAILELVEGEPIAASTAGPFEPLRLSDVTDIQPGHPAEETPRHDG